MLDLLAKPLTYINLLSNRLGIEPKLMYGILISIISLIILLIVILAIHKIKRVFIERRISGFFNISDLSKFRVRRMGKPGTQYYREDGVNSFELALPHWKNMLEDGSRDKKRLFNKVVCDKSFLWLHAGRKVYILSCKDPLEMIYLVHTLRDSGLDIAPCIQELDKQIKAEEQKLSVNKLIYNLVQKANGDREVFIELCKERLQVWGYTVAAAPQNSYDMDLFVQRNGHPSIVRCLLTSQGQLISLDYLQSFKQAAEQLLADNCMLITTGSITVAAAGYAKDNKIDIVCGEQLIELVYKDSSSVGKEYLDWELTNNDIIGLLDEECAAVYLK